MPHHWARLQIGQYPIACVTQPFLTENFSGGMSGGGGALVIIAASENLKRQYRAQTQNLNTVRFGM